MGDQPPVTRTFIHDAESLLWILVWVVAHRSQEKGSWKVNAHAQQLIANLSQNDMCQLGTFKADLLEGKTLGRKVQACNNDWSRELAPVVHKLAVFFQLYFYETTEFADDTSEEEAHELMMNEPREATFDRLFAILDTHIARLKDQIIDLGLL
jgi:hypothetical protein